MLKYIFVLILILSLTACAKNKYSGDFVKKLLIEAPPAGVGTR